MKLKALGLAALAAMTLTACAVSSASASTLEIGGVTQNGSVLIQASLGSGTTLWSRADGTFLNTCIKSSVAGDTETFTGSSVTGAIDALAFEECTRTVTVHQRGTLHVSHIDGTTDGTVSSSGTEVTVGSPYATLKCKTENGVDIGVLTGASTAANPSTHAILHINAVLNCGFFAPTARWVATYTVTSPTGLGVSA